MSRGISDTGFDKSPRHLAVAVGAADCVVPEATHVLADACDRHIDTLNFNSGRLHSERQHDQKKYDGRPRERTPESRGGHTQKGIEA